MSYRLYIFTDPAKSDSVLTLDNGMTIFGQPGIHPSGREGTIFVIPETAPNQNGCHLEIKAEGRVPYKVRSILYLQPFVGLVTDDFYLQPETQCPDPIPAPDPQPEPGNDPNPLAVINAVYKTGLYDLNTKSGCGEFTEACAKDLNELCSKDFGHLKKTPPQNCYPTTGNLHHAVDALNLKGLYVDNEGNVFEEGIYDIIYSSESPEAKPVFNKAEGHSTPSNWLSPDLFN